VKSLLLLALLACSSPPDPAGCRVDQVVYPCEGSFYVDLGRREILRCVEGCPVGDRCGVILQGAGPLQLGYCDGTPNFGIQVPPE